MSDIDDVSIEEFYEIQKYLYRESRLLSDSRAREWLEDLVDKQVSYQLIIKEERFRRAKTASKRDIMAYSENYTALELRVTQMETGLSWMNDPVQRLRYFISNIEVFNTESSGHYKVYSNGIVYRNRRVYDETVSVYGREDVIRRDSAGKLKLLNRIIKFDQRVVKDKNLLFFM